ncbi:PH domain-containing protein [Kordiimonas gwangyangensis]|nr:PH domain-containing protein [Kordiimonas gwangyangensis]
MYLKRLFFVDWASPVALLSVSLSFLATPWFLLLNLLPALILPFMWLNYRRLGYWSDGRYFAVRTGLIGHKLVLFPLHKAQSVKVTRTPGQRRRGLATLTIKLAGHKVKIPYVPDLVAKGARDHILRVIFAGHTPWM